MVFKKGISYDDFTFHEKAALVSSGDIFFI